MPSEPRVPTEPTVEELSAYLDHELEAQDQARVAEHVAGCAACQARFAQLRQTAYAIRALPMETPPRTFTVPEKATRRWTLAPVGWLSGAAAAALIIYVGVTQVHFPAAGSGGGGGTAAQLAPANKSAASGAVPYAALADQRAGASQAFLAVNGKTVSVPGDSSRSLTVGTDARTYPASGMLRLRVATSGITAAHASGIRIYLVRDSGQAGYAIKLAPPTTDPGYPTNYAAAYSIAQMPLPSPVAGDYTLQVEIDLGDGSTLIASLPLTITG